MAAKYPECRECYYNNRAPEVCDECVDASEFDPADSDDDEQFDDSASIRGGHVIMIHPVKTRRKLKEAA